MKLIFEKDKEKNIEVKIRDGLSEKEFSYIEMIKMLIKKNEFEASEYDADITEEEKDRINNMLSEINEVITAKEEKD